MVKKYRKLKENNPDDPMNLTGIIYGSDSEKGAENASDQGYYKKKLKRLQTLFPG